MTQLLDRRNKTYAPPDPAEDLIPEARLRHRRRLLWTAGIVSALVGLTAGLLVGIMGGGGTPRPFTYGSRFASVVSGATAAAGPTSVQVTYQRFPNQPSSSTIECRFPESTSIGTLDLQAQAIALTVVPSANSVAGCVDPPIGVQYRQFGSVVYEPDYWCEEYCGLGVPSSQAVIGPLERSLDSLQPSLDSRPPLFGFTVPIGILQTPFLLAFLDAIHGNLHQASITTIRGKQTRSYTAVTTLGALQSALRHTSGPAQKTATAFGILRPPGWPGVEPPASDIVIHVRVWIDSTNRLVRISASEPYFSVGGVTVGPQVVRSEVSGQPVESGTVQITTDLYNFGSAPPPVRPRSG